MPADGTTNGWVKIGKSNTSYGILPSAAGGAGNGHNYIGTSSWYWKYAYIDEIYGHLNGNATGATKTILADSNTAFTDTATVALNGLSIRWYSTASSFSGQPATYGFLITMAADDSSNELHQIFATQDNGSLYHRGTNGSSHASPPEFKTILDSTNFSSYALSLGGGTLIGNLVIAHPTSATMTAASTNPKITFSDSGSQPVHLIYTDYDSYRSPAGLKIVGGENASPAWFEVEGAIYASSFPGLFKFYDVTTPDVSVAANNYASITYTPSVPAGYVIAAITRIDISNSNVVLYAFHASSTTVCQVRNVSSTARTVHATLRFLCVKANSGI